MQSDQSAESVIQAIHLCNPNLAQMAPSTVNQRIAQLIQQLGISKNAFAMSLGKTASVIQHLVDGRNKPGYDLLFRIFEIYPNVSRDWLILGRGPLLTTGAGALPVAVGSPAAPVLAPELPLPVATAVSPPPEVEARPPAISESAADGEIEVPPLPTRRPAAGAPLQPADIAATLALAAATARPARATMPAEAPAPAPAPSAADLLRGLLESPPAPVAPAAIAAPDAGLAALLHTQYLQHQLALAELRNQHLLEQQKLLREMLDMARSDRPV